MTVTCWARHPGASTFCAVVAVADSSWRTACRGAWNASDAVEVREPAEDERCRACARALLPHFQRFWVSVDIRGASECWAWIGNLSDSGYGVPDAGIQVAFSAAHSHCVALSMAQGPCNERLALHSCDNRRCCNPRHLRWGTDEDNTNDKATAEWMDAAITARLSGVVVGGQLPGVAADPRSPARFAQGLRRVDWEVVLSIREDFANGMTSRRIAEKYGISRSHADNIAKRRIWKVNRRAVSFANGAHAPEPTHAPEAR